LACVTALRHVLVKVEALDHSIGAKFSTLAPCGVLAQLDVHLKGAEGLIACRMLQASMLLYIQPCLEEPLPLELDAAAMMGAGSRSTGAGIIIGATTGILVAGAGAGAGAGASAATATELEVGVVSGVLGGGTSIEVLVVENIEDGVMISEVLVAEMMLELVVLLDVDVEMTNARVEFVYTAPERSVDENPPVPMLAVVLVLECLRFVVAG